MNLHFSIIWSYPNLFKGVYSLSAEVFYSEQFQYDYERSSPQLQHLAKGVIRDLFNLIEAEPKTWRRKYDQVEGLPKKVLELKPGSGDRLLAVDDGDVILWRLGDHDLIRKVQADRPMFPTTKLELPGHFTERGISKLFPPSSEFQDSTAFLEQFVYENAREWIYQLDDQQYREAKEIFEYLQDAFLSAEPIFHVLTGGPGTGKTTILLWLLKQLSDLEPDGLKLKVRIEMQSQVLSQIRNSTGWDLNPFLYEKSPDVLLIDDPRDLSGVTSKTIQFKDASVVVGLDLLQLSESVSDSDFQNWVSEYSGEVAWISNCYRQKKEVGEAAKHVFRTIANSSPFLDSSKKLNFAENKRLVTEKSNELEFGNPGGVYRLIEFDFGNQFPESEFTQELVGWFGMIKRLHDEGNLWIHSPPLLIALGDEVLAPEVFADLNEKIPTTIITVDDTESVKGLDFQHVAIFLKRSTFEKLNSGFEGSGQSTYNKIRLLRILFSRGKDSLYVFVFPNDLSGVK